MEVCFLASGERLAVLDEEQFHGQSARDMKRTLADGLGVSRFLDLIIIFYKYISSGKHTKSYWKLLFIVDLHSKNGDFP